MAQAILALGSNLGDREAMLDFAVASLSARGVAVLAQSKRRETAPVDVPPEFASLAFLNAALRVETALPPEALLRLALAIEAEAGRVRTVRNGPRPLDIDLILYAGERRDSPELTLPHPRAAERAFVLEALADLGVAREDVLENRLP